MPRIAIYFRCNSVHMFIFRCSTKLFITLIIRFHSAVILINIILWCCIKSDVRNSSEWCKLYSLICDPDGKIWIFGFFPGVCPTEPSNLVFSLGCLVSNGRRALLGGIRLGGSVTMDAMRGYGEDMYGRGDFNETRGRNLCSVCKQSGHKASRHRRRGQQVISYCVRIA